MNKKQNIELIQKINSGDFPKNHEFFGGANLIISNDPSRNSYDGDTFVISEHAGALSWLVYELKKNYNTKIDVSNKYQFYPLIGDLILDGIVKDLDLFEVMLTVINGVENEFGVV